MKKPNQAKDSDCRLLGIGEARAGQAIDLARLIARAFHDLDLTRWLVPDPGSRLLTMAGYLQLVVEHAMEVGHVAVTRDISGVAVWLPFPSPDVPSWDQRLKDACQEYTPRFQALDTAMHRTHPSSRRHDYLSFLAVHPARQGEGIGSALLRQHHRTLDQAKAPAYLEAASAPARRFYQRHGYQSINYPFGPEPGQSYLHPMWREPHSPSPNPDPDQLA